MKEVYRLHRHELASGHEVIMLAGSFLTGASFSEAEKPFWRCGVKLDLWSVRNDEGRITFDDSVLSSVHSPLKSPCCRFILTCSEYALEAIQKYGAIKGSWLAVKRILKCHPFHKGGYDPVP